MRRPRRVISESSPNPVEGFAWESQCARCGATTIRQSCVEPDCASKGGKCLICDGLGGWQWCSASTQECNGNPLPGRDRVQRGKIEWFAVRAGV